MAEKNEEDIENNEEEEGADNPKPKVKLVRPSYSSEQYHDGIQKARLEEREKLQEKIADLERKLAKLSTKNGGDDIQTVIKEAVAAARTEWDRKHANQLKELGQTVSTLAEENRKSKFEKAKQKLIAEYENQVIPALIIGETEEELEASAESAHEAWKQAVGEAGIEFEASDESDEDDESENEEDESEEESDESDEEEEVNSQNGKNLKKTTKKKVVVIKKKSPPANTHESQVRTVPPVLALTETDVRGRRNDPMAALKAVKGMAPAEYRANRAKIIAATKQKFG